MLCGDCRKFLNDEQGGGTVMGLLFSVLLIGICGLAVDITSAVHTKTMLQATADAAALGAVIDLPDEAAALSTALEYAAKNMPPELYGTVLIAADVELGDWNTETHIFTTGVPSPDAVRVKTQRTSAAGNEVMANFLRIIGIRSWNVEAYAIAQKVIPKCFADGIVAAGIVDTSSNNSYYNNFCVHGEQGVNLQSGNNFELGTTVSMPDVDSMLVIPNSGMESNPGLTDALKEEHLKPRMPSHIPELLVQLLDPQSIIIPDFIDTSLPVIEVDWQYNFNNSVEGRIYHVNCPAPNKKINLPSQQILSKVVIVADCQIGVPAHAVMEDVYLASQAAATGNDGSNIHFAAGANLGRHDNCSPGGGVKIFTSASLSFSSSTNYNGVQIISAKNVSLGSSDEGVLGIVVQAGGNVYLSSNNAFGLCNGDEPLLFTIYFYRLVF